MNIDFWPTKKPCFSGLNRYIRLTNYGKRDFVGGEKPRYRV